MYSLIDAQLWKYFQWLFWKIFFLKILTVAHGKFWPGEVARLKSYITQRPPFDVKNPYMAPIHINRNLHKAR
jgi:hypothetical protein